MSTAADRVQAFLESLPVDQDVIATQGGHSLNVADLVILINRDRQFAPNPASCPECGVPVSFSNEHLKGGITSPGWRCPA